MKQRQAQEIIKKAASVIITKAPRLQEITAKVDIEEITTKVASLNLNERLNNIEELKIKSVEIKNSIINAKIEELKRTVDDIKSKIQKKENDKGLDEANKKIQIDELNANLDAVKQKIDLEEITDGLEDINSKSKIEEFKVKVENFRSKFYAPEFRALPLEIAIPYINSIKVRADPTPLPEMLPPKYPIVLSHGIGGDKFYGFLPYFYQIKADLELNNCLVLMPKVPPYASVYDRSALLCERINEFIQKTGAEKVNIIGHSMGGLDARHVISNMGGHKVVASLTTIGTPHRGSMWAELLVGGMIEMKMDKFVSRLAGLDTSAYMCVRPKFLEETFNPATVNRPEVAYFSYAGAKKTMASMHPLHVPYSYVTKVEGENDGLVSVDSAKWGHFIETLDLDHSEQINWCLSYDARRLYRQIANFLRKQGF